MRLGLMNLVSGLGGFYRIGVRSLLHMGQGSQWRD